MAVLALAEIADRVGRRLVGRAGYELSEPDHTDAVRLLHSTFYGYVRLEAVGGFRHRPLEADASWSRTLNALDVVLRNWPPAT
ncbi:TetR-like C-terminal domain-containing protein [Microtetraspora sp. NBRC 16547]|uniref:TetR-like C-terminal domain-containing protein n=1 Tax=Microtetraspora sp. NBRC 16547 TaxID=3030993 RepID=UPI0024A48887|nr:TetR-like C-terminal domain-containing protein [Microtetraspora sp. NBRC 16547]GLW97975.1 hypothetical protein Misp02_20620 [Microtetraspora sp. NBRC 16547]